jgi:acetyl esterase/lipase
MRFITAILLILSVLESVLWFVPIPSETLWPANMIAHEIWPWMILVNLLGLIVAGARKRWSVAVFVIGLGITVWPLADISKLESDVAAQWTSQGISATPPAVPNTSHVLRKALSVMEIDSIEPNAVHAGIYLFKSPSSVGHEPLPTLIDIHGGSWQQENALTDSTFASYMAAKGYAVFSIDYRKAPENRYPIQIDDVRAAIDWIYANAFSYGADPRRIALVGRSAGGHLALLDAFTSEVIPIRAVISFYGPADLTKLYDDPPKPDPLNVRDKLEAFLGGSPGDIPTVYRDASPISHLKADLPPTLLIQGGHDHTVPARHIRAFYQKLTTNGSPAVLVEIPWSEHGFDFVHFGPGSILALAYADAFLKDVLPPATPPIPE